MAAFLLLPKSTLLGMEGAKEMQYETYYNYAVNYAEKRLGKKLLSLDNYEFTSLRDALRDFCVKNVGARDGVSINKQYWKCLISEVNDLRIS